MKKVKKLLEIGVDGGGCEIYLLEDGTVVETGSAGGMLDDEEDKIRNWDKQFPNFEAFWEDFKNSNGEHWVMFYPLHIDESVVPIIKKSVSDYKSDNSSWGLEYWEKRLENQY
jgi:hypothetical protein